MMTSWKDFKISWLTVSKSSKYLKKKSGYLYLGLVSVEQSVAKGISSMAVFVSFNGGHNYFKFQSYCDP